MSFSSEVKAELSAVVPTSRHCQLAELLALFIFCGHTVRNNRGIAGIKFSTESVYVARKCFTLLKKTFNIGTDILQRTSSQTKKSTYIVASFDKNGVETVISALKLFLPIDEEMQTVAGRICCRRAFLRGAFLTVGSISDPEHSYHFEIACDRQVVADTIRDIINSFETGEKLEAKITIRKKHHVVYVKEGSQIVDLLNLMGAHNCLMELENLRVMKEMRNNVNRRVNCDTANINKTVNAAAKQIEDIEFLRDHGEFESLSKSLLEMALIRLDNPEIPLKELGELLDPPVGKSGVNHRLRKLSERAAKLRESRAASPWRNTYEKENY